MSPGSRRGLLLGLPVVGFFVLLGFLAAGLGRDPSLLPSALLDRPLPGFQEPGLLDTDPVTPADLTGQVSLLNVWATWCPPCREEMPYLVALAESGVTIHGLAYKDDANAVRQWLAHYGNPFRTLMDDADGSLGLDLGVYGAPETFLLDADGVIRYRHVGIIDPRVWEEDFLPRIRALEEEPS
jgi:cytochrome c biogenesis protein CcmG/thiol:disulfide interchange protein DsbE